MAANKLETGLVSLFKKYPPKTSVEALEAMGTLAGGQLSLAIGVDKGSNYPVALENEQYYLETRKLFQGATIYLTATACPELQQQGMNMPSAIDSIVPLLVEKVLWTGVDGDQGARDELAGVTIGSLLRAAVSVYIHTIQAAVREDMNAEQLEAKGQDILDGLSGVFEKLLTTMKGDKDE